MASDYYEKIWEAPRLPLEGAWLWWFWLFFIHDEDTIKTGKCRQIMILWSIKRDKQIFCNELDIRVDKHFWKENDGGFKLDGAHAAWYYDGKTMREGKDFVLEKSLMTLDLKKKKLEAPGKTPSEYYQGKDEKHHVNIDSKETKFEFTLTQDDFHHEVGPNYGKTKYGPFEVEGTRIEVLTLYGTEKNKKTLKTKQVKGTAYFQKILVAAPPPEWYWGLYHFADGSFATYMQTYVSTEAFAGNDDHYSGLKKQYLKITSEINVYHAPSGKNFKTTNFTIVPKKSNNNECWIHELSAVGDGFELEGKAEGYARACWTFNKQLGILPLRSTFKYNEYPSTINLTIKTQNPKLKTLNFHNGWGNMENAWGMII